MDDFVMMIVWILIFTIIFSLVRNLMSRKASGSAASASSAKPQAETKNQIAEDIKATKTSQVVDAVAILDDLGTTSSNYRHYCELVGTSMASGGVTAPYSRRQVAYYDIKCYRIDASYGGGQKETLVAHERSFEPFFFTDASSDTPIYVDLESFGNNVILVNSTNHVEGPDSDFAKAFKKNATTATSSGTGTAFAMVARSVAHGSNALLGAVDALRRALRPRLALEPALACAGGGSLTPSEYESLGSNVMFSRDDDDHDRPVTSGRGGGSRSRGGDRDRGHITVNMGNGGFVVHTGPTHMPQHLGDFMGGYGSPWVVGGGYNTYRPTANSAEVILGMGLGALLNSMNTVQQQVSTTTSGQNDTFRGYRLVENVVPLRSPIYCIGEIYRNGIDVYMGRSLAKDYPTSYFATKPESEVLSAIGSE